MGTEQAQFSSALGSAGRIVAARVYPNLDVLSAIEDICCKYGIEYGQITTTIGSLRRINLHYVSRTTPVEGKGYTTHLEMEGPFSVLSGQGLVSPSEDPNRRNIHYHAVVSGENDVIYGGHIEKGTITLTTLDMFILELYGIEISRQRDPQTSVVVTMFEQAQAEPRHHKEERR